MRLNRAERRLRFSLRSTAVLRPGHILMIALLAAALIMGKAFSKMGDIAVSLALSEATDRITLTVNEVIAQKVADGSINYSDLVSLQKDENGGITALVTNMANINALQAEVTSSVVTALLEEKITEITVPVGSLMGSTLLSGRGPGVKLRVLSVTNVTTRVKNEFSAAGINQTLHQILLEVEVSLGMILDNREDQWESVSTELTVAETVIVGTVPGTYANFG